MLVRENLDAIRALIAGRLDTRHEAGQIEIAFAAELPAIDGFLQQRSDGLESTVVELHRPDELQRMSTRSDSSADADWLRTGS